MLEVDMFLACKESKDPLRDMASTSSELSPGTDRTLGEGFGERSRDRSRREEDLGGSSPFCCCSPPLSESYDCCFFVAPGGGGYVRDVSERAMLPFFWPGLRVPATASGECERGMSKYPGFRVGGRGLPSPMVLNGFLAGRGGSGCGLLSGSSNCG